MDSSNGTGVSAAVGNLVSDRQQIDPNAPLVTECKSLYQELQRMETIKKVKARLIELKTTGQLKAIVGFSLLNSGALPVRSDGILLGAQGSVSPVELVVSNGRKTTWLESELAKRFQNNVARNKNSHLWQPEWDAIISISPKLKERIATRKANPSGSNRTHPNYVRQTITCSACKMTRAILIKGCYATSTEASSLAKIILNSLRVWNSEGYTNGYQCGCELQVPRDLRQEDQPYVLNYACGEERPISDKNMLSNLDSRSCTSCHINIGEAELVQYEINGMKFPMCNNCLTGLPKAR